MTVLSIVEVFAATGAALGTWKGAEWLIKRYFPKNAEKRQEEATTKQVEVSVEKTLRDMFEEERKAMRAEYTERLKEQREEYTARIKDLHEANEYLNNQNLEQIKEKARKDEVISDKVNKIRKLEDARLNDARTHAAEIARYEKLLTYYKNWFCEREQGKGDGKCGRRKPAQNPPLKFAPIEVDVETTPTETTTVIIQENDKS